MDPSQSSASRTTAPRKPKAVRIDLGKLRLDEPPLEYWDATLGNIVGGAQPVTISNVAEFMGVTGTDHQGYAGRTS